MDYVLRCTDSDSAPTWILHLLDYKQRKVGSISIAADTGAVLTRDFGNAVRRPASFSPEKSQRDATPSAGEPAVEKESAPKNDLGHRVDRSVRRVGADLEVFFTGRRTLDRDVRKDEEPETGVRPEAD